MKPVKTLFALYVLCDMSFSIVNDYVATIYVLLHWTEPVLLLSI